MAQNKSIDEVINASRTGSSEVALHEYAIPKSLLSLADGVTHLGLCELTVDDELTATKRARGDGVRLAFELVRESFRSTGRKGSDGKVARTMLSSADGSMDKAWAALHPKLRQLVVTAYNDLHSPKESDVAGFLESRVLTAG